MNERYIEKKKLQLQYEHLPILFTASAIIQLFAPYQSDSPMRNATLNILLVFLQYGIVAIAALLIWMRKTIILENIIFIIPCVIATLFPILDSYKNSEFSGLLMLLLMISFLLLDSTERYHTLVYFRIVWLIICVIGIFCFLSYLLSVPLPYKELNYYNMSLESLNVQQRYITLILNDRADVDEILRTSDSAVFPSISEGLGISVIEMQAAGLPCIVSEAVPMETVISNKIRFCNINDSPKTWADMLISLTEDKETLRYTNTDEWDIHNSIRKLEKMYEEACK